MDWYSLSYQYYALVAVLVQISVGLIVSAATGPPPFLSSCGGPGDDVGLDWRPREGRAREAGAALPAPRLPPRFPPAQAPLSPGIAHRHLPFHECLGVRRAVQEEEAEEKVGLNSSPAKSEPEKLPFIDA